MSLSKKILLRGVPVIAIGGAGVWMLMNGFGSGKEQKRGTSLSSSIGRIKKQLTSLRSSFETTQPPELKEENETLDPEEDSKLTDEEPSKDVPDPLEKTQEPDVVIPPTPKEKVGMLGLVCGDATRESDCEVLEDGLNVDIEGDRRENYELAEGENGTFKLRISEDPIFGESFRFIVTKNPIKLKSKTDSTQTITLQRYENYGLVKDDTSGKVYLTRKLNADQGKIRSLGLSSYCTLPKEVSTGTLTKPTCVLSTNQIKSVNFDAKKNGGATINWGKVDLYIQKVNDTNTYRGGYKFTFQPQAWVELEINENDKIKPQVRKDFMLQDPDADDLVLEKVWKDDNQLLGKFGLICGADKKCTIGNSLKIKREDDKAPVTIEDGRKKEKKDEEGEVYLVSKDSPDYFEGMMLTVWGKGGITIESSADTKTTIKMEELGLYYITKEEKDNSSPSYYLNVRKEGVEEMISKYLGIGECKPRPGIYSRTCGASHSSLWGKFKFHDGDGEQRIKSSNDNLSVILTIFPDQKSPLGYKFNLEPKGDIKIGKISLKAKSSTDFQIMRDVANKKLYLEKA